MTIAVSHIGRDVWHGRAMAESTRWRRRWPDFTADAIDTALATSRPRAQTWQDMTRSDFPLPSLRVFFDDVADELENGCGMVNIAGLPVARWSLEDLQRIYFGIGLHLGRPVFQNRRGELMRLIRDEGRAQAAARYGATRDQSGASFLSSYARTLTNGQLRFHTDRTDVVALLCVRQAESGGLSRICSSPAVHNAMLERRPDLARRLHTPVRRSRYGEESDRVDDRYDLPVWSTRSGKFTSHFSLTYIEAAHLGDGETPIDPELREALDMLLALADEFAMAMRFAPGDIQLLNSHVTYHGRSAFIDDEASGQDRLLLRLWLAMPNSRALPEDHQVLWGDVAAGALRGGIGQEENRP
jgi:hypothetical protein